ncbi:DedA family protein [Bacillus massiliigorillae]|uniref:DedA family protein n=1 Tax=Bacillus massiliigorillae TaxID=1243664 RepID=UPI0003AA39B5|nr:DedA family protein [Bacillus massiliigorillae]
MGEINLLLEHFGYIGIIIALVAGLIGLPIPDEILLTYVGYNVFQGNMAYELSLLCAFIGSVIGISISYILGHKLGSPFLHKYGHKIHLTEKRLNFAKVLFDKFGPFLLFSGYFIPGVRHVTAYLAGINCISYRKFALFAYPGAIVWGFTFITLGRELGRNWSLVQVYMTHYSGYLVALLFIILIIASLFLFEKERGLNL